MNAGERRRANAEFAEDAEGAEKSEEKRVCIVRSSEPTYRKRREGGAPSSLIVG